MRRPKARFRGSDQQKRHRGGNMNDCATRRITRNGLRTRESDVCLVDERWAGHILLPQNGVTPTEHFRL
jgi:hypothetical protein